METEQTILRALLLSDLEASRRADSAPTTRSRRGELAEYAGDEAPASSGDRFLGIRYALVCWLDELFTCDSPWGTRWNEQKLEMELYGTNDRAWNFWRQARLAQARPGGDALEVCYLCVMLGFRGELLDRPQQLSTWVGAARHRLGRIREKSWPYAPQLDAGGNVPPLRGREKMRRMVLGGWTVLLALAPVAAFLLVHKLAR